MPPSASPVECFPGEFASLKDRLYYDEVIQKLQQTGSEGSGTSLLP